MKRLIVVFACIGFFIVACGNSSNNNGGDSSTPPSSEKVADGKTLFKKYCIACHGADGEMGLNGAKKFTKSTMTVGERIIVISEGRKLMTPFKGLLKEDEIKAVAAYTMILSEGKK